ncbi:diacylglycerol kinase family protein [Massilioclostridium coli]|uniref:diacylglycerol kinase family protein n=1 Tax=Massilioclostridium coli TaxID=1870991 RepID=UPI00085BC7C6|nr:diacylglycerol kinase family protein [Massilioclostridium coli]
MKFNNKEFKGLVKSFSYAFRGIWFCIKNERNMRIHITASVFVLAFSFIYGLTPNQYAILALTLGSVMMCELVNTAIEAVVNLTSDSYDNLARIAKDVAAGAVLLCAIAAVGVGIALFGNWDKLLATIQQIISTPWYIIGFALWLVLGIVFIFHGFRPKEHTDTVKIYRPKKSNTKMK